MIGQSQMHKSARRGAYSSDALADWVEHRRAPICFLPRRGVRGLGLAASVRSAVIRRSPRRRTLIGARTRAAFRRSIWPRRDGTTDAARSRCPPGRRPNLPNRGDDTGCGLAGRSGGASSPATTLLPTGAAALTGLAWESIGNTVCAEPTIVPIFAASSSAALAHNRSS